jgi:hypothetical protein
MTSSVPWLEEIYLTDTFIVCLYYFLLSHNGCDYPGLHFGALLSDT